MTVRFSVQPGGSGLSGSKSWLVDVTDDTSVAELAESIGVAPELIAPAEVPSATLAQAGIFNGAVLPAPVGAVLAPGTLRLEVVGGPFSGVAFPLRPGVPMTIGSAGSMDLCIADPHVTAHHATLTLAGGDGAAGPLRASLVAGDADAVTYVNGAVADRSVEVVPADIIQMASSLFRIGIEPYSDADISADEVGMRGFNRPSRIPFSKKAPAVMLPGDRPEDTDKTPLPWLSAVIPVVLGVTMAILFARPVMLIMAAASPVMVIGTFLANRARSKKKGERTFENWSREIVVARDRIAQFVREQRLDAWYRWPDPVVITDMATRPLARLWERRMIDTDSLQLRFGVSEVDLDVRFEGGTQEDRLQPRRVGVSPTPIAADLSAGVLGVAGPPDVSRSTARAMLAQLATLRSPRDTQIIVLCDEADAPYWEWVQWLPHAQAGNSVISLVGNTDDSRRERLRELSAVQTARMRMVAERAMSGFDSHIIVVIDGARRYRMLPGMVQLLESGSSCDMHVIALDTDRSRLPEEAKTVIQVDDGDPSLAHFESASAYHASVLLDGVSIPTIEKIARSLCSINHIGGAGDEAMLPTAVRFVSLLDIDLDAPQKVVERWTHSPRRTSVVVGAGLNGQYAVDIASDGPHALVAGTTGSGKSEFLQALIVSLALSNRPDALNFVLIDYKGASAFDDFEGLPHRVGTVTNLDARETERALVSLDAELKRRESILRVDELRVKDVDAAWAKNPAFAAANGLARLVIVIDEFAELKAEHPEFITGLVRIARVGRSLGVHLILATQRPSGSITPEMQSNINLRVALRVTDRADSTDVLGSAEASLISVATPGRGYVRSGVGSAPVGFQTARVAGIRPGAQRTRKVLPPTTAVEWSSLGSRPSFPVYEGTQITRLDQDDTDLRALVTLIADAAKIMQIPRNPSPWLVPLPNMLPVSRIEASEDTGAGETAILLGLEDVPDEQRQRPLVWDLATDSHLMFIGGASSGRTTVMRTLLSQIISHQSPADAHLYLVDYGSGGLLPLAVTPHVGAVVTQMEPARLPRLFSRIIDELARRQAILSKAGVGSIVEQRRVSSPENALPYVVLAIDGWERVTAALNADDLPGFRDQMMRILREGASLGIRVVITADRGVVGEKITGFIDTQYVLPLRDVSDYRAASISIREIPENMPPGRVLFGPSAREAQIAVIGRDPGAEAQAATLRAISDNVREHYRLNPVAADAPRPLRVDVLPTEVALSAVGELPVAAGCTAELPTIGVGGDELSRFTIDWPVSGGFAVIGDRGSGKSGTLASLALQLASSASPVLVVSTRESALTEWARATGTALITDVRTTADDVNAILAPFGEQMVTVIIDDLESVAGSVVEVTLMAVRARLIFAVSLGYETATKQFSGPFGEVRKQQQGILLSPTAAMFGQQVFGLRIPRFMLGRSTAGSGVLFHNADWVQVQVPDFTQ
jgi:DNA segregation ATPase FtsK/SpoIIIE, S-DNA-T family